VNRVSDEKQSKIDELQRKFDQQRQMLEELTKDHDALVKRVNDLSASP
jgi:DNA-binding ferritin-like protein